MRNWCLEPYLKILIILHSGVFVWCTRHKISKAIYYCTCSYWGCEDLEYICEQKDGWHKQFKNLSASQQQINRFSSFIFEHFLTVYIFSLHPLPNALTAAVGCRIHQRGEQRPQTIFLHLRRRKG
jgi:hypothetical protein